MDNKINKEQLENIIKNVSENTNISPEELKKVKKDKLDGLLNKLNPKQAQKLQEVLSSRENTEKLLQNPAAQMLLKKFLGSK